jgi:hypothetical protein
MESEHEFTEEVLEWERKGITREYSPQKLLPTDPTHFTDLSGQKEIRDLLAVPLPDGWVWDGDWVCSSAGWQYAWNVTVTFFFFPFFFLFFPFPFSFPSRRVNGRK